MHQYLQIPGLDPQTTRSSGLSRALGASRGTCWWPGCSFSPAVRNGAARLLPACAPRRAAPGVLTEGSLLARFHFESNADFCGCVACNSELTYSQWQKPARRPCCPASALSCPSLPCPGRRRSPAARSRRRLPATWWSCLAAASQRPRPPPSPGKEPRERASGESLGKKPRQRAPGKSPGPGPAAPPAR